MKQYWFTLAGGIDLIISKYKNKMKWKPITHARWNKTATAQ